MFKVISVTIAFVLFLLNFQNTSSANLFITDPRNSFAKYPGTIEDITFTVKPNGTYINVDAYIKISPKGSGYTSSIDTLEANLTFELPSKSYISNMWLFMNDSAYVEAQISDKWTATFIYEGIVSRRKDPSLLLKVSENQYNIKIFPMLGHESRTVKMSFNIPAKWDSNYVSIPLPIEIFNTSYNKKYNSRVFVYKDSSFTDPSFVENPNLKSDFVVNDRFGQAYLFQLSSADTIISKTLKFKHNFNQGIFASFQKNNDEGYYQLLIDNKYLSNFSDSKKIAFLIDYDINKSAKTRQEIVSILKSSIKSYLMPQDSFNIFLSNEEIYKFNPTWISATSENIEDVFNNLSPYALDTKTHLPLLIRTASKWVNQHTKEGMIILIANSDSHGTQDLANSIGEEIGSILTNNISFTTCNFLDRNWITNWVASTAYTGNDYLYSNLAKQKRGIYNKIQNYNDIATMLNSTFNSLIGGLENVNISSFMNDGFTYDKVYFDNNALKTTSSAKIIEYGKYQGDLPLTINIGGYFRHKAVNRQFKFDYTNSSMIYDTRTMWAANSLRIAEASQTNGLLNIYDIINKSLDYRVLSIYTAFLALDTDSLRYIAPDKTIVPVELVYFNADSREQGIDLYWATASELNNLGFYVERKELDSKEPFKLVKFVEGNGTSSTTHYYNIMDKDVQANKIYQYKLRQIDRDGTYSSKEAFVTVKYDKELNFAVQQISPNPMNENTTIKFTIDENTFVKLEIIDINGDIVQTLYNKELQANSYEVNWNGTNKFGSKLPLGMYLCRLSAGDNVQTMKIIINK